jgi:RNA polymerase sigma-70 factor (ECF subfamily)
MSTFLAAEMAVGANVVDEAAAGDKIAFGRLIAAHHAQMMRVAHVITGDADAAADAVQSAWELAWRRLGSLRDRSQVRSWLVAVAANEARQVRRRQRRTSVVDITRFLEVAAPVEPADAISLFDLKQVLARLKPEDRTLLALRYVGRLDSNEIARHLGMSASGVRSRLERLLDRLRVQLEIREDLR